MKRLKLACLALFLTPLASFVGTAPAWGHDMPIDAAFACVGAGACEQSSQHDDADPFKGWIILTVENTGTEAWGDFHFELFQVTDPIDNVFFVVDSPEDIFSSKGKTEVVAPISAPILQIVPLPVQEIDVVPSPKYSTIAPVPPLTERIPASFKITSFGEVQPLILPVR